MRPGWRTEKSSSTRYLKGRSVREAREINGLEKDRPNPSSDHPRPRFSLKRIKPPRTHHKNLVLFLYLVVHFPNILPRTSNPCGHFSRALVSPRRSPKATGCDRPRKKGPQQLPVMVAVRGAPRCAGFFPYSPVCQPAYSRHLSFDSEDVAGPSKNKEIQC